MSTYFQFFFFKQFCRTILNCLWQFVTCVHLVLLLTLSTTEQTWVCIELIKQWRASFVAQIVRCRNTISAFGCIFSNGHFFSWTKLDLTRRQNTRCSLNYSFIYQVYIRSSTTLYYSLYSSTYWMIIFLWNFVTIVYFLIFMNIHKSSRFCKSSFTSVLMIANEYDTHLIENRKYGVIFECTRSIL